MSARIIKKGTPVAYAPYVPAQTINSDAPDAPGTTSSEQGAVLPFTPHAAAPPVPPPAPGDFVTGGGGSHLPESFNAQPTMTTAEADDEAAEILQHAHAEAGRIIAGAQATAAHIETEAHERGLEAGRTLAAAEVEVLAAPLREELTASLDALDNLRAALAVRAERDMVRLAVEMAKKIVRREVTLDGDVALTLARVALGRLHSRAAAVVRLHPDDCAYAVARVEGLARGRSIEIIADTTVARGGCLVETEMGDIDARIEQQFAELEREFLNV